MCDFFDCAYYARCLGISRKAFSSLCSSLEVPFFHLNNRAYVRYEILLAALASISLIGQPDFMGPASSDSKPRKRPFTKRIDLADYEHNLPRTIHSILWGLKLHRIQPAPSFESELHTALSNYMASVTLLHTQLTGEKPTHKILNPETETPTPDGGTQTGSNSGHSLLAGSDPGAVP